MWGHRLLTPASRAARSAQRHGRASPPPPRATEPMGVTAHPTRQGPSSQEWAERQQERHTGSRAGQPGWLRPRPAAPHRFSGNSPSQRGRNPESGQWVSGWLHSLRSVYQPLCAPAVEAGSRRRAPQLQSAQRSWFPQDPRSTLSQPQLHSAGELPPWPPSQGITCLPPAVYIESSKLNPKSCCGA